MARAAEAFRYFRDLLEHHKVQEYRAVATSAAREARNREALIRRIGEETGIQLEVIDAAEEARLVRLAVLGALGKHLSPRLIVDLGGGSLEVSLLRGETVEKTIALPLGTVRLIETLGISDSISEDQFESVRHHVLSMLQTLWPAPPDLTAAVAIACGGNPEALARIAAGPRVNGIDVLNLRLLRERLWQILRLDVSERVKTFKVRRDRAEVMGIAAIVLTTLAHRLHLRAFLVPGVGVRDGTLYDLARAHFGSLSGPTGDRRARALPGQMRQASPRRRAMPSARCEVQKTQRKEDVERTCAST